MKIVSYTDMPTVHQSKRANTAEIEQAFLAEMFKLALPTSQEGAFSGGMFSSWLTDEYSKAMASRIGRTNLVGSGVRHG